MPDKGGNGGWHFLWGSSDVEFYETVQSIRGNEVRRIKSSLFYLLGFICIPVGIYLVTHEIWFGAFLILTACPCFLLYPLVRLLFGGKDSVAAVVGTAVVEEVLKSEVKKMANKNKRKR